MGTASFALRPRPTERYNAAVLDIPLTAGMALPGPLSLEAGLATIPPETTVKGLFFRRFADLLGPDYENVSKSLEAPVKQGKYLPFRDYPQRDYARMAAATARKRFPTLTTREAMRHIAREDFKVFADSMVGKVVLTVAGDARSSLLHVPAAYKAIVPAAPVRTTELDPHTVRLVFEPLMGFIEYTLGQLEGVVLAYDGNPLITIHALPKGAVQFDVVHRR